MPQNSGRGVQRRVRVTAPEEKRVARTVRARELMDEGVEALRSERVGPAQRKFRQALGLEETCPDARAYLALTYVLQQQWERALREALAALRFQSDHVPALTLAARAHYGAGRPVEANNTALQALQRFYGTAAGEAETFSALEFIVEMLVFMHDHRRLHQLYRRRLRGRPGPGDEILWARLGIAAFNCGHHQDARWAWRRAHWLAEERAELFAAYLLVNGLVEDERIPPFLLDYALSAHEQAEPAHSPSFLKVFALRTLWHGTDEDERQAALDLLIDAEEEWVASFLLSIVREPELSDALKLQAGTILMELGLVPEDEAVEMHVDGSLQSVVIRTEQMEMELDEETAAFFGEALEADAQGLGAAAEAGYRSVLEAMPTFVPALLGLATIYEGTGRLDEAERLLDDALRIEPRNPFIQFHLATLAMQQEKLDEAWERLQTMKATELSHGLRSAYYWLFGRLALLFDSPETAEGAFLRGLQGDPNNSDLQIGLKAAREAVAQNRQQIVQSSERRRKRYEEREIAKEIPWVDALGRLTVPRLQAMARHIGIAGTGQLRKAELVEYVGQVLREELAAVWHALAPREQAALRWLDARGGVAPYAELQRRFGSDAGDSIDWLEVEPETVPMRLQFYGLVFVGRLSDGDEPVALLPQEARQALKFAWRRTP